jgi:PAS domain S-box-containing protein
MKLKGRSIRSKLIRFIAMNSAISLLLVFAVLFIYEIFSYRQNTIREVNVMADMLAENSTAALAFDDVEAAYEILSAVEAERLITSAGLYKSDGNVFVVFTADSAIVPRHVDPNVKGFRIVNRKVEGFAPVMLAGKRVGTLYIERSTADADQRLMLYAIIASSVIVVSFVLTYLLSRRLQRAISNPLISLSDISAQVSERHDYSVRATDPADGEIGQLRDAFNTMLSKIEIQNNEIQRHNQQLEFNIDERTKAYRREKEFAEVVVNSSLVLITVFDKELRFIGYNDKAEEEFGLKRDQVLGHKYEEVMPQAQGTLAYNSLIRALNGEFVHNPQYRSPATGAYYESFVRPLKSENDEIYAVLMTAHNITALVETNAELQKRNTDLEQFAYVASHDLQEPLRKVMLFTDRLINELPDPGDNIARYLDRIEHAARRMSRLINDVLSYSRLQRLEESFVRTNLNEVLRQVLTDLDLLVEEKGAVIESDQLPVVNGNTLQLHQLFSNLINNALKFSNVKPSIRIKCSMATADDVNSANLINAGNGYAKIQVIDNGIGFDREYADKVFTLFQRLHPPGKYEGTGIGLALCKKIVSNHQGSITVDSTPGVGTTFTVLLPRAEI